MSFEIGAGLWLLLALAVGILAAGEFGRSGFRWFLLALIFTPLAGLLLFLLPPRRRPCPFCAEPIQPTAVLCRFCGREVPVAESAGLPKNTRRVLLLIVVAVMLASLSQCHERFQWWRGDEQIEVQGPGFGLVSKGCEYGACSLEESADGVPYVGIEPVAVGCDGAGEHGRLRRQGGNGLAGLAAGNAG